MTRLRTRIDKDNRIIWWRLESSQQEYDRLSDLLREYNQVFGIDSAIVVKIIRPGRVLAKMTYSVTYDSDTDELQIDGLLGVFQGPTYETLNKFRNIQLGFADSCQAKAVLYQNYEANEDETDRSDSEPDSDSDSDADF